MLRLLKSAKSVVSASAVTSIVRVLGPQKSAKLHASVALQIDRNDKGIRAVQKEAEEAASMPSLAADPAAEPEVYNITSATMFPTQDMQNVIVAGQPFGTIPIAHIKASYNNTIISITDYTGKTVYSVKSGGTEGFRNARKRTDIAAQSAGSSAGQEAAKQGLTHVRAEVKGIGPGRLPCIKGLKISGLEIVSLTDVTPVPFNGPKPQKRRKL